jgi:hypothetical protein
MIMLLDRRRIDAPMSRHSKMKDQGVVAIGIDEPVFGSPAKSDDASPGHPLAQVDRKRAPEIGAPRLDIRQAPAIEHARQSANRRLDFRKFRHSGHMAKRAQAR